MCSRFQAQADVHFHFSLLLNSSSATCFKVQADLSDRLKFMNGLGQGHSLACLLFSFSRGESLTDSGIQTRSTIFYTAIQLPVLADDIRQ